MKKILLTGIRFYQRYLSPIKGGSTCKFYPTCSQYSLEAIATHGAMRGAWFAAQRLGRCHPWGGFGYDPVPLPLGQYFYMAPKARGRYAPPIPFQA